MPSEGMDGMKSAAVYVRISKDEEGEALGIRRQMDDCRALAERRGWTVRVYPDNDTSAVKYRPEFDRMLRDIKAGDISAVVAYSSSRLYRDVEGDKARLFAACLEQDHNGDRVQIETVVSGTIDPYTADGRMLANILASVDAAERERVTERTRRAIAEKKANGEWIGRVPYGWRLVDGKHLERDEKQQAVILDAARRYIAGESYNAIAASIAHAESKSGHLPTPMLCRILQSDRVHDALPDDVTGPLAGAILHRRFDRAYSNTPTLLGGIARCGVCGTGMTRSSTRARRENCWYSYRCPTPGHSGIAGPWLEQHVTEAILDYIDSDRLQAAIKRRRKATPSRKASKIEALIDDLDARYTEGKVSIARYDRMNERLLAQLAEAQNDERQRGVDLPAELARDLSGRWPTFPIVTQRRIIQAVTESIVVTKATGNGPIDPDRVKIAWRA